MILRIKGYPEIENTLDVFGRENNLQNVALTYIPSSTDDETAGLYKINPKASNTIFIYKKRKVIGQVYQL